MSSSPKVLDLDGCFSSENPTMIMVTLLLDGSSAACCLSGLRFGLVFWSFLCAVDNRFGLFCLGFPPVQKLDLIFSAYGSVPPPKRKRTNRK